jgi:5'-deoxynucleotidase YfbR-like HD superfamily hydrolase
METKIRRTIKTFTGIVVDYEEPHKVKIDLLDIANSLSKQCRFAGNIKDFYSVAEHCCILYDLNIEANPVLAKALLIHDASETYVSDIPSPLKRLLPEFQHIENNIQKLVYEYVNLEIDKVLAEKIVEQDKWLLTEEKVHFQGNDETVITFECWNHREAFNNYVERLKKAFPALQRDLL